MSNSLVSSQKLAEKIRFSGDQLRPVLDNNSITNKTFKNHFYQNGLQITREVTPHLHLSLSRVCSRLRIPMSCLEAFVYASPELQAECYSSRVTDCTLRFTSALIDLLDNDEFDFVIGHELGHFLLHHSMTRKENNEEDLEYYIQQRAQEISADRLGLIACKSLDVAISALIKIISGLSTHHLRLDVGTFISQLKKSESQNHIFATHPSVIVRSRALLWFSLGKTFRSSIYLERSHDLDKLDSRIIQDLDKYVDGEAKAKINEARRDLYMWMAAHKMAKDGRFDRIEQRTFIDLFGEEILKKLLTFLNGISDSEILNSINEKMIISRIELEKLIPSSFENEVNKIENNLNYKFN